MAAACPDPAPAARFPGRRRRTRRFATYETLVLLLVFLSCGAGMFLFGAVRPWSIGPLAGLSFAALLLFFVRGSALEWRGLRLPFPLIPLAVLLLYMAGHTMVASRVPDDARLQLLMTAGAAAGLFLWIQLGDSSRRMRFFLGSALVLASVVCWYAIIQHERGVPIRVWTVEGVYGDRVSGTYICPNHFANLAAMALVASFALLFTPGAGAVLKVIAGYALLVAPYPLYLSQSRAGLIGAAAGLLSVLLLQAWRRSLRVFLLACLVVPLLAAGTGWVAWTRVPELRNRFQMALREWQSGQDWRMQNYLTAIRISEMNPAWGQGGGSFRWVEPTVTQQRWKGIAVYAHNEPLQILAEYGWTGVGLAAAAVVSIGLWALVKIRRASNQLAAGLLIAALGAALAHGVHGLFDFNWHIYANNSFLIMLAGLAMASFYHEGELPPRKLPRAAQRVVAIAGSLATTAVLAWLIQVLVSYFFFRAAQERIRGNQPDLLAATRLCESAVKVNPGSWRAHIGLADMYAATAFVEGNADRARRQYELAGQGNPFHPDVPYGLSRLAKAAGDLDAAQAYLQRAADLTPVQGWYLGQLGILLKERGRNQQAFKTLQSALKLDSTDWQARLHYWQLQKKLAPKWTVFPEHKDPLPVDKRGRNAPADPW